jgi:hypothetical protein
LEFVVFGGGVEALEDGVFYIGVVEGVPGHAGDELDDVWNGTKISPLQVSEA